MPRIMTLGVASLAASLAHLAPSSYANDCRISVAASPMVLREGQTARISAFAHFPATSYAFAAADFDILSTAPAWSSVSSGAIVGDDVLGISVGQNHNPFGGAPANPTNPLRIWSGQFTAVGAAPALVIIQSNPTDFWTYPSAQTASSAPCIAAPGAAVIFVNPLPLGPFAAAPAPGTSIEVVGDSFVAQADPQQAILIGTLLPAIQKVRTGIVPDGAPDHLTIGVHVGVPSAPVSEIANPSPEPQPLIEEHAFNFIRIDQSYQPAVDAPGDVVVRYRLKLLDRVVDEFEVPQGEAPFIVHRLADAVSHELVPAATGGKRSSGGPSYLLTVVDFPGGTIAKLGDGSVRFITSVEVSTTLAGGGPHVRVLSGVAYSSAGVDRLTLSPR